MTSSSKMNDRSEIEALLSAVQDGEASTEEVLLACQVWRQDEQARARWHAWAVVGDALRSDDLVQSGRHDADFLNRLRARMATEPVVLAPLSKATPISEPGTQVSRGGFERGTVRDFNRRWAGGAAVAAGFVAVAGALVVLRSNVPEAPAAAPVLALAPGTTPVAASAPTGILLRNPELEQYLAAHQQFAQGPGLAAPGGVRRVVATPNGR